MAEETMGVTRSGDILPRDRKIQSGGLRRIGFPLHGSDWLPWIAVVLAGCIHLLFLASLSNGLLVRLGGGMLNPLFNDAMHRLGQGCDFFAVYQAGHNLLNGVNIYVYSTANQVVPYAYPFRYLPIMAMTVGVLTNVFAPMTAYWIWVGVNEALLFGNIALAASLAPDRKSRLWIAAMWLCFFPFYLEMYMGQFSFVMATLLMLMGYALVKDHRRLFGYAWIASALWKLSSLIISPLLIRLRRYRELILCFVLILLLSAPYFLFMPGTLETFLAENLQSTGSRFSFHAGNLGFQALVKDVFARIWRRLIGVPWTAGAARAWTLSVAGSITALSLWATFKRTGLRPLSGLAIWVSSYFLIYQDVWEHHYVMILPILVLLYLQNRHEREPIVPQGTLVLIFIVLAMPTPFVLIDVPGLACCEDPQPFWAWWQSLIYHAWKSVPVLLLWALLIVRAFVGMDRHISRQ